MKKKLGWKELNLLVIKQLVKINFSSSTFIVHCYSVFF